MKDEETRMCIDWKFIIGDVIIPIVIFIAGLVTGTQVEKRKRSAKSKIKGNGNKVIQNSEIEQQ